MGQYPGKAMDSALCPDFQSAYFAELLARDARHGKDRLWGYGVDAGKMESDKKHKSSAIVTQASMHQVQSA